MGILFENKSYIAAASAALAACVMMIVFSDIAVQSAKEGIALWTSSVLPAMLPFFICVNFMTGIGLTAMLPAGIFPFAMSALSGYPVGAKVIGDMCRSGITDIAEAKRLISYCSTSGPVFMVGAVGVGMLGSQQAGYVIAVSHYAGAVINGIVYSGGRGSGGSGSRAHIMHGQCIEECDLLETLTVSIFSAFRSMAVILAYIIFFMFIMELVETSGVLEFRESAATDTLVKGFLEMTVGCSSLTGSGCGLKTCCVLAATVISWGGLSVLGQSMSMLSGTGIRFGYLALTKLTHSIFAGIIALFLGNVML